MTAGPSRWEQPERRWHRPPLRALAFLPVSFVPLAAAVVLLAGDLDTLVTFAIIYGVNHLFSASQEDAADVELRASVPGLSDDEIRTARAAVAAGELPADPELVLPAVRYAATWSEQLQRYARRARTVLLCWVPGVVVTDLALVAVWPASAGVRHPAALVAGVGGLLVGGWSLSGLRRRDARLRRITGD